MKHLLFIHGAWSTKYSFNYLIESIKKDHHVDEHIIGIHHLEYDSVSENLSQLTARARKMLAKIEGEVIIVGHSLGGLIALALANMTNVSHILTASAPLSGVHIYKLFQPLLIFRAPFLVDAAPGSNFIHDLKRTTYKMPVDIIVSTKGYNPAIVEPSDGVVTIETQKKWVPDHATITMVEANHHEILQAKEVRDRLFDIITGDGKKVFDI